MSHFVSLAENIYHQPSVDYSTISTMPIILCDFDGTISIKDVTDTLIAQFGRPGCDELEAQWIAGDIGSQTCMREQIKLLDANLNELDQALANVEIDPSFKAFVEFAISHGIAVHIVSDGLDYAILSILKRHGLNTIPVFANRLLHDNDRHWRLEFPYGNINCTKASGNCKCNHLIVQRKYFYNVFYVGDGTSDFCVSNRVDWVFAKDNLIKYCCENGIEHTAINSFSDVTTALPMILTTHLNRNPNETHNGSQTMLFRE